MSIRPCTLAPGSVWIKPTGAEVREVLKLCGFSGTDAASFLGMEGSGGRSIRRWCADTDMSEIPYSAWALLCVKAGMGEIFL